MKRSDHCIATAITALRRPVRAAGWSCGCLRGIGARRAAPGALGRSCSAEARRGAKPRRWGEIGGPCDPMSGSRSPPAIRRHLAGRHSVSPSNRMIARPARIGNAAHSSLPAKVDSDLGRRRGSPSREAHLPRPKPPKPPPRRPATEAAPAARRKRSADLARPTARRPGRPTSALAKILRGRIPRTGSARPGRGPSALAKRLPRAPRQVAAPPATGRDVVGQLSADRGRHTSPGARAERRRRLRAPVASSFR